MAGFTPTAPRSTYQGVEVSGWQACHKGADVGTQVLIECHLPAAVGEQ